MNNVRIATMFNAVENSRMGHPRDTNSYRAKHCSKMFDAEMLTEIFENSSTLTGTAGKKFQLVRNMVAACDADLPKCRNKADTLSKPWWNDETRRKREETTNAQKINRKNSDHCIPKTKQMHYCG